MNSHFGINLRIDRARAACLAASAALLCVLGACSPMQTIAGPANSAGNISLSQPAAPSPAPTNSTPPAPLATPVTVSSPPSTQTLLADANSFVLQAVAAMPAGGGYATTSVALQSLEHAITIDTSGLQIATQPIQSFCSGATYLVFLKTLALIEKNRNLITFSQPVSDFSSSLLSTLLVRGQSDGTGTWGRWNANGPGTARLFYELSAGLNFDDFTRAKPGDFMKIWWTESIGMNEEGHSVIYMGTNSNGEIGIWSSNTGNPDGTDGMGLKWFPRSSIVRAVFSRLTNPNALTLVPNLPTTDSYLAAMLSRSSTPSEMSAMIGLNSTTP